MTMKKGEGSNPEQENQNLSNEETQKVLKVYGDTIVELQKKIDALSTGTQVPGTTTASDIMKLADAITQKTKKELSYEEGIYEEQIPADDYLDQKDWVRFCVPSAGYVISDDRRKGHIVKLPHGKPMVFFEHLTTNRKAVGKHTATIPVATYTSKSKKEVEWLRAHSFFGTLIFEDMGQVADTTIEKALRLGKMMEMLSSQEFPNIVAQCRDRNIPFNSNPDQMKKQLAIFMVEKEISDQKTASQSIAEEAWKSEVLLGRKQA